MPREARGRCRVVLGLAVLALVVASLLTTPDALHDRPAVVQAIPGDLAAYPRPDGDNGRGIHWFPAPFQTPAQIDLYVQQLQEMDIRWVIFLGGPRDFRMASVEPPWTNAYLVSALREWGMEPVLRFYMPVGRANRWDFQRTVRYYRKLGVRYIQVFNEPNRPNEWNRPSELSPKAYVDYWLPLASIVVSEGGFPGFGALDPLDESHPDAAFLAQALAELERRGREGVLARTWLALHNYTDGNPSEYTRDRAGFARFEMYNEIVTAILGYSLPIIGTEGVLSSADGRWRQMPDETARLQAEWVYQGYEFMKQAPAYLFAFSPWLLGNAAGGGDDEQWETGVFFRADGTPQPVVERVGHPVYLIKDGERHWAASAETLAFLGFGTGAIKRMPRSELAAIPTGQAIPPIGEGSLVKGSPDAIYLVRDGLRRWVPNPETFIARGYRWDQVLWLPDWVVERIPEGRPLPSVLPPFWLVKRPSQPAASSPEVDGHPLPDGLRDGDLVMAAD